MGGEEKLKMAIPKQDTDKEEEDGEEGKSVIAARD